MDSSILKHDLLLLNEKKNIQLIPINPNVCFATTNNSNRDFILNNTNEPAFVPIIDISGKKYFPVYIKQPTDNNNDKKTNGIKQEENQTGSSIIKSKINTKELKNIRQDTEIIKDSRAKTVRIGNVCWPPLKSEDDDYADQQRRIVLQRAIHEEIHGRQYNTEHEKLSLNIYKNDNNNNNNNLFSDETVSSHPFILSKENFQVDKILFEHLDESLYVDSNHDVGKLINYFENYINDLNKDLSLNSKSNLPHQLRTTSQNTSNLSFSFVETPQPLSTPLPTIFDDEDNHKICDRTFSDDIYDRLTYQTIIKTNSCSSRDNLTPSSTKSVPKRRRHGNHQTHKKRLHRRRVPTYIKELKAYLAHRDSSSNDISKVSDVKKFSNVLIWLSNQTTSSSAIETTPSTPTSLIRTDNTNQLLSNTTDSVIALTQDITLTYTDPFLITNIEENTSQSSSRQSFTHLTYNNILWKLKIRKEVFSPKEKFDEPLLIDLLYLQIVSDVFSSKCIRISDAERTNMKIFLSSHGVVNFSDHNLIQTTSIKKAIIEQARQWSIYFCRFFPISVSNSCYNEIDLLGISHVYIHLIKKNQTTSNSNTLEIVETFSFDSIQNVSSIRNNTTIDLVLLKRRIIINSHRIEKIKQMIKQYLNEQSNKKLMSIPISNTSDLFKSSSQASLMSLSQTFSEMIPSTSLEVHTPKPIENKVISELPRGYSMMEFALQHFKTPHRKRSRKTRKKSDWKWKNYAELIKWSKNPLQTSLLPHSSNDSIRIARQCSLAIMRFMGDHNMSRHQTYIDCLFYLLKTMYKHRTLIDEVLCQIIKQLTDNKSVKSNSVQRGWKLLAIILNYFIPSELLKPYFLKFLEDNHNKDENLLKLCLNHYEQTLKYGGRKITPNKTEIDLVILNNENINSEQTFLLPGGFPLILSISPSMVIRDCLDKICEQLNLECSTHINEYSIFIISNSENSSRLLNPNEYIFDTLSEIIQLNITKYHLIVKRMLWFHIPFDFDSQPISEMFIDFMYHQIVSDLMNGTMILLKNNQLSNEYIKDISHLIALQYHISNKIGLPSMKDVKYLLPRILLKLTTVHPQEWTSLVDDQFVKNVQNMAKFDAKIKFLNVIQTWPLFGTTFFTIESTNEATVRSPCLLGLSKNGITLYDSDTREMLFTISFNDILSICRRQTFVDIEYGTSKQSTLLQCEMHKAQDFLALTGRYLNYIGRNLASISNDPIVTIL